MLVRAKVETYTSYETVSSWGLNHRELRLCYIILQCLIFLFFLFFFFFLFFSFFSLLFRAYGGSPARG